MTARELIRELAQLPPDTEIFVRVPDDEIRPDVFPARLREIVVEPHYGCRRQCPPSYRPSKAKHRERVLSLS